MATTAGCESCVIRVPLIGEINFGRFASSCCGVKPPLETEEQKAAKAAEAEQARVNADKARRYDEEQAILKMDGHIDILFLLQQLKRIHELAAEKNLSSSSPQVLLAVVEEP